MARIFGKIELGFWHNPKVRTLSDPAKLLLAYLYSCPHGNGVGCFVLHDGYICADMNWGQETVSQTLSELFTKRFAERDSDSHLLRVIGWWGHNTLENQNVARHAASIINALPNCAVKQRLVDSLSYFGNRFDTVWQTVLKPFGIPLLLQPEPEPEPEPKEYTSADADNLAGVIVSAGMVVKVGEPHDLERPIEGPPACRERPPDRVRSVQSEIDVEFAEWYAAYPRKEARGKALKAYRGARKKVSRDMLLNAVRMSRREFSDPKFTPQPASWLNGERWADEGVAMRAKDEPWLAGVDYK